MHDYLDCYIQGIRCVLSWSDLELLKQQEMLEWGERERPCPWRIPRPTWGRWETETDYCDQEEEWGWLMDEPEDDADPPAGDA